MADEQDKAPEQDQDTSQFIGDEADKELLLEIREKFRYYTDAWAKIREEGATDVQYSLGNPWSEKDKRERDAAGRPALSSDQLSQYLNQAINNLRQSKIGIKIEPQGNGANDKTAFINQGLIRGIEYDSNAQQLSYIPAFENAITRSYGFVRVTREYVSDGWEQVIKIKGIKNPDSVLYDPDVRESDWSDAKGCFVVDPMRKDDFKRQFPDAKIKDFGQQEMAAAPEWITSETVMVGEYLRVEYESVTAYEVTDPETKQPVTVYSDEIKGKPKKADILRQRKIQKRTICKYLTNGIEILEKKPQPGIYIPIVPVIGKEVYATEGGRTKRYLLSLIRMARDPYMLLCYLLSQETEEAAQMPKAPVQGYVGQFETDKKAWNEINKVPHAYIQVDPIVDGASGQVLPMPTRPQFQPNFQAYELAIEARIRGVQAAMGINPLPTPAARQNEKSGVALERIQTQTAVGSFHFTDNFTRSLELVGKILLQWIPVVYNTEREVGIVTDAGEKKVVKLNPQQVEDGKADQVLAPGEQPMEAYTIVDEYGDPVGNHTVTISTGPNYDSEREEADEFLDKIISNLQALPVPPPVQAKLLSLAVKARDLGVFGDEIADLLSPPPEQGQDPAAELQQLQQKFQQAQQLLQQQHELLAKDTIKQQTELQKAQIDAQTRIAVNDKDNATRIVVAQINTKSQEQQTRDQESSELWQSFQESAHEAGMQAQDHAQQQNLQQQAQEHATQQQQSQQASDQQAQQMEAQQAQSAASGQQES